MQYIVPDHKTFPIIFFDPCIYFATTQTTKQLDGKSSRTTKVGREMDSHLEHISEHISEL